MSYNDLSLLDPCRNRWGAVKLKLVQDVFGLDVTEETLPEIRGLFVDWRDTVELLPMRLTHKKIGFMDFKQSPVAADKWIKEREVLCPGLASVRFNDNPGCEIVSYEHLVQSWINKKSVKRGNDVYCDMLAKKFSPLLNSKNHKSFFSMVDNSHRKRVRHTRMLYLTGTCDHAVTGSIAASWVSFGAYWNEFITRLRGIFGKCAYIRTWQSQDNGYPHYHALVYFLNFEFSTINRWDEKQQKSIWRIHNRQTVVTNKKTGAKTPCINAIVDLWKWGGLEVVCCDNTKSALRDLLKYVLRDLEGGASDQTNTLVWYFKKKSFAISKSFEKLFGAFEEPSNADLINAEGVTQEGIQEGTLVSIDVFPVLPRDLMPGFTQLLIDSAVEPPDPPHELINFYENFADSCSPVSSRKTEDGVVITVYDYKDRACSTVVDISSSVLCKCSGCGEFLPLSSLKSILGVYVCKSCNPPLIWEVADD